MHLAKRSRIEPQIEPLLYSISKLLSQNPSHPRTTRFRNMNESIGTNVCMTVLRRALVQLSSRLAKSDGKCKYWAASKAIINKSSWLASGPAIKALPIPELANIIGGVRTGMWLKLSGSVRGLPHLVELSLRTL